MKYAVPLKLGEILLPSVNLEDYKNYSVLQRNQYTNFLQIEILNILSELDIYIQSVEVFYKNAYNVGTGMHVDDVTCKDFVKINWVYGDRDATMEWFEPICSYNGIISKNPSGHPYLYFDNKFMTCLHKESIKSPSIVQVGIPHTIRNITLDRWAVSVTIRKNNKYLSMEKAEEIFNSFI